MPTADTLDIDQKAIIDHVDNEAFMGRLLSLGIVSGSSIIVQSKTVLKGARIVKIDDQKFALRMSELKMILVRIEE